MRKYKKDNLGQALDDLVNIRLASVGFRTVEKVISRFKGYKDFQFDVKNIPKSKPFDIDSIITEISHFQYNKKRTILCLLLKVFVVGQLMEILLEVTL